MLDGAAVATLPTEFAETRVDSCFRGCDVILLDQCVTGCLAGYEAAFYRAATIGDLWKRTPR